MVKVQQTIAHQSGISCLGVHPFSREFTVFLVCLSTKKNRHEKISQAYIDRSFCGSGYALWSSGHRDDDRPGNGDGSAQAWKEGTTGKSPVETKPAVG
jgi:hypothetical protein